MNYFPRIIGNVFVIYIYICMYKCVCVCVCACVRAQWLTHNCHQYNDYTASLHCALNVSSVLLSQTFRFVSKGIHYIHSSPLKFHGNLKSSNCVVDNRWVLKVTDFGMKKIRKTMKSKQSDHQIYQGEKPVPSGLSVCLSVCRSVSISIYLAVFIYIYFSVCVPAVYISIYLLVCLYICLSVYLFTCLCIYIYLPAYLSTCLSVYLHIYLPTCLVFLYVCLSVCISSYLSVYICIYYLSVRLHIYLPVCMNE